MDREERERRSRALREAVRALDRETLMAEMKALRGGGEEEATLLLNGAFVPAAQAAMTTSSSSSTDARELVSVVCREVREHWREEGLLFRPDHALLAAMADGTILAELLGSLSQSVLKKELRGQCLLARILKVDHHDGEPDASDVVGRALIERCLDEDDLRKLNYMGHPLMLAVIWNHRKCIRAILDSFTSTDEALMLQNSHEQTVLHKLQPYNGRDARFLLELAPVSVFLHQDASGNTPLHAVSERLDSAFLAIAANRCPEALGFQNAQGMTPLMIACSREIGMASSVRALLPFCTASNLAMVDKKGHTALYVLAGRTDRDLQLIADVALVMDHAYLRSSSGLAVKRLLNMTREGRELASHIFAPHVKRAC